MLGSLLSVGAGIAKGLFAKKGADKANKQAAASVDKQLAFQKESAQKSYQWATQDMKKAGINPMLAYQQGGSSALSGSNYTPQNAAGAGVSSATAADTVLANLQNLQEQNKNLQAQNAKIQSDTKLNSAYEKTAMADAALKATTAKQIETQTQLIGKDITRAKHHQAADKTYLGKATNYLGRWWNNLGGSSVPVKRR
jgi:hypothetical protein